MILKEMDEDFTEDELDEIIAEVWLSYPLKALENEFTVLFQIDTDKSDTIDFNEFVKIMTWH